MDNLLDRIEMDQTNCGEAVLTLRKIKEFITQRKELKKINVLVKNKGTPTKIEQKITSTRRNNSYIENNRE